MSGDLAENAADGEYEIVRELLAQLGAPVYVLPGNLTTVTRSGGISTCPEQWERRCSTRSISGRCGSWSWTARDRGRIGANWMLTG